MFMCIVAFSSVIIIEAIMGRSSNSNDEYVLISCEVILFIIEVL